MNSWKIIEISEEQYGKVIPYVSIGHNHLAFNKAASDLIDVRRSDYRFAQFLKDESNPNIIGVRFWREEYVRTITNSVPLKQKESKGKPIGGIDIGNSYLLKDIFGSVVTNNIVTRFRVRKDDTSPHILVIDLKSNIGEKTDSKKNNGIE